MLARAVLIAMLSLAASFTCYSQEEPPAPEMPSVVAPPRAEKAPVPKGAVGGTVYCADTNNPARLAHISLLPIAKEGGRSYRGESDLEGRFRIGNLPEGLLAVEIQSRLGCLRLSHLHRLSFEKTIRSAGRDFAPNHPAL